MGMYWWLFKMDTSEFSNRMSEDQAGLLTLGLGLDERVSTLGAYRELTWLSREDLLQQLASLPEDLPAYVRYTRLVTEDDFDVFAGCYYLSDAHKKAAKTAEQMKCIVLLMPEMKYLYHKFEFAIQEIDSAIGNPYGRTLPVKCKVFGGFYPAPFCQYMAFVCTKDPKTGSFTRFARFFEYSAYVIHLTYFVVLTDDPRVMKLFIEMIGSKGDVLERLKIFQQSLYAVLEARIPEGATHYRDLVELLFVAAVEHKFNMQNFGKYSCVLNDRVVEPMDTSLAMMLSGHGVRLHPIAYSVLRDEHKYMGDIDAFLCLTGLVRTP